MENKNKQARFINGRGREVRDCEIIVDTTTGVNYLCNRGQYGIGLTVLVDENGKPIVTKNTKED